jgi:hypothetical protein
VKSVPYIIMPRDTSSFTLRVFTSKVNGLTLQLPRQVITIQQD